MLYEALAAFRRPRVFYKALLCVGIFLPLSFSITTPVSAAALNAAPEITELQPQIQNLATHPTWLRLLHLKNTHKPASQNSTYKPDITSEGFYLSDSHAIDPRVELNLTLELFSQSINTDPAVTEASSETADPLWCTYPSRFLWLQSMGAIAPDALDYTLCTHLSDWASLDDLSGLSLVQVSGFFANPASAFGHVLLQVNGSESSDARGLLDLGVNFGASVPDDEGGIAYIVKGLFGGYEAAFSDKAFYAHDRVYSAIENRDMWSHQLDLTVFQRTFLLYHLWELKDARFKYYFLSRNCAYYVAKLLEIVLEESFDLENRFQYPPIDLFHKVQDIDKSRRKNGEELISSIDFIPSNQRSTYHAFNALENADQEQVRQFVDIVQSDSPQLDQNYSSNALDFLLQYVDYKSPSEGDSFEATEVASPDTLKWRALRRQLLSQRFKLPPSDPQRSTKISYDSSEWDPPTFGPKPRLLSVGATRQNGFSAATFDYSPYNFNALQRNKGLLKDASFELAQVRLRVREDEVVLDKFELITIEKLTANGIALRGERQPAWFLSFGAENRADFCTSCVRGFLGVGFGKSRKLASSTLIVGLAEVHTDVTGVSAGASFSLITRPFANFNIRWKSRALGYLDSDNQALSLGVIEGGLNWLHELSLLYSVAQSVDVIVNGQLKESGNQTSITVAYRF